MRDYLLELGKNPQARRLIKTLGLPIPVPQELRRPRGPREDRPLAGQTGVVGTSGGGNLTRELAHVLAAAGARSYLVSDEQALALFNEAGEAFAQPPTPLDLTTPEDDAGPSGRVDFLVFDATTIESPEGLHTLYDFFHPLVRAVGPSGRAIVIGRPPESLEDVAASASQMALNGFVRSLAKEVGKRGATAQLLYVEDGAEDRLAGPLRFFLSDRSAYVSGQPLKISAAATNFKMSAWTCPLEHKVALVTGAARGIGAATARILASEGAHVVCLDRPQDDGPTSKLAREIGGTVFLADVTDADTPDRLADFLDDELGGVDIVVHNAGVTRDKTIARMKPEQWESALDVNLGAVVRITQRLLRGTLNDGGRLIMLSSIAGVAGNMGQTNYAASKAGVIGLVRALSPAVAERGITVNAIAPGFIETRLTDAMPFAIREVARRLNNLGQGGRPGDIGQAIAFLATPASLGVTGQVLRVCGGSMVGA